MQVQYPQILCKSHTTYFPKLYVFFSLSPIGIIISILTNFNVCHFMVVFLDCLLTLFYMHVLPYGRIKKE